jgi:DNA-directed RNA polymerase specialized sigma24 family protein
LLILSTNGRSAFGQAIAYELVEWLQQEVKRWPASEQEAFELYYLVGFDAGDIARIRHERKEETDALIARIQLRLRDFLRRASVR